MAYFLHEFLASVQKLCKILQALVGRLNKVCTFQEIDDIQSGTEAVLIIPEQSGLLE